MQPSEASTALEIHLAMALPSDPAESTARHEALIAALVSEAAARGWGGAVFCAYGRQADIVSAGITEAAAPWPGIAELRAFRERQKAERQAEIERQQQGSLFNAQD
jgi:hypothetical protein